jgi:hypothetical protein
MPNSITEKYRSSFDYLPNVALITAFAPADAIWIYGTIKYGGAAVRIHAVPDLELARIEDRTDCKL